jgi:transmembrane sensor
MMGISNELILRFFEKNCTTVEAEAVAEYLKENPEALEKILSKDEWDETVFEYTMPEEFWRRSWGDIQKKRQASVIPLWVKCSAVAASVLFIIGAGWLYFNNDHSKKQSFADSTPKNNNTGIQQHKQNVTDREMMILLQDSSTVYLSPNSEISYVEPFAGNKRDIHLMGGAFFKVAKDAARPFTVYSDVLSTTALGTQFSVTSFEKNNNIRIKLIEGKIVVRSADGIHKKLNHDIYLLPGYELRYDKKSMTAAIVSGIKPNNIEGKRKATDNYSNASNWYMFNNQGLADVLERLKELYGVDIQYSKTDLKNMYFIGRFDKSDSLTRILNNIAILNNLSVKKQGNIYIITK